MPIDYSRTIRDFGGCPTASPVRALHGLTPAEDDEAVVVDPADAEFGGQRKKHGDFLPSASPQPDGSGSPDWLAEVTTADVPKLPASMFEGGGPSAEFFEIDADDEDPTSRVGALPDDTVELTPERDREGALREQDYHGLRVGDRLTIEQGGSGKGIWRAARVAALPECDRRDRVQVTYEGIARLNDASYETLTNPPYWLLRLPRRAGVSRTAGAF